MSEFPLRWRVFLRGYPWRRVDSVPWAVLARPLAEARVALVTSAGLVPAGEPPFDERVAGGDWSHRVVPADVDLEAMVESHRSELFDHAGVAADRNLALPIDRLRELVATGEAGEVAPRHASIMGSLTAPGRLVKRTAPAIAEMLRGDGVDAAALVPV
ncbi:MAG: selenoprotein B glycine/betaine/sarcosine/D-proline reductase [Acidobacteria bacterium]|nr:selenoprotein B glycine/betaine/sarcosine/D-proline reductase [Acidobacteriota bacterium]